MPLKIGVLGSAFDPPTRGHLDVMQQVAGQVDRLLLVPSAAHAFAKQMTPFLQRVAMLERLLADIELSVPVTICTLEQQLLACTPEHPVYTYDLLDALAQQYRERDEAVELVFVRGPDNAAPETWSRFYRAAEIEQRWQLFTASERLAVRSSSVRALCKTTVSTGRLRAQLAEMLTPGVIDYLIQERLYRA